MAMQRAEWEYLYQTSTAAQLAWEIGGPDAALEKFVEDRKIPAKATVLDIGCGLGSAAVYLAALGHTVTGIDVSATAVEKAKRKASQAGVTVTFVVGDILTNDFKRKSFSFLYDRGCLQHLPKGEWPKYRDEVLRLLSAKGIYIVEISQDVASVDALKGLFAQTLVLQGVTTLTHVERATGIPRYHTVAFFVRK